jgi:hypothetical protein
LIAASGIGMGAGFFVGQCLKAKLNRAPNRV